MSNTNSSDEERETGLPLAKIKVPTPQPSARELELESRLESLEEDHRLQLKAFEAAHLAQTKGRIAALHEHVRKLNDKIDALEAEKHRLEAQIGQRETEGDQPDPDEVMADYTTDTKRSN